MRKIILPLILLFLSLNINAQDESAGKKAPNVKFQSLEGETVSLSSYYGKGPVLLSFWATWCKPCVEELKEYQKINDKYKEKGLKLLGVSTDSEKSVSKVKPFINAKGFDFEVLLDTNMDGARKFYAQNIPYSVLLDKNGNIVYSHLGYKKGDEKKMEELISKMLAEK